MPGAAADAESLSRMLTERRGSAGVDLRVPQRGDKRALMETVGRNAERGADPAQDHPRLRPDRPATRPWRRSRRPWSSTRRRCGSSASTSPTCRAPRWSPRWSSSRTACPARASTAGSSIRGRRRPERRRRHARGDHPALPPAIDDRVGHEPAARGRGRRRPAADRPDHRRAAQVRVRAALVVVDGGRPRSRRRPRPACPCERIRPRVDTAYRAARHCTVPTPRSRARRARCCPVAGRRESGGGHRRRSVQPKRRSTRCGAARVSVRSKKRRGGPDNLLAGMVLCCRER